MLINAMEQLSYGNYLSTKMMEAIYASQEMAMNVASSTFRATLTQGLLELTKNTVASSFVYGLLIGYGAADLIFAIGGFQENIVCVIDNSSADFTQMIVGAYDTISGQFLGSAVGEYDGLSNTITVAFDIDLPESFELNVFCTDNDFSPQYKVSQFTIGD